MKLLILRAFFPAGIFPHPHMSRVQTRSGSNRRRRRRPYPSVHFPNKWTARTSRTHMPPCHGFSFLLFLVKNNEDLFRGTRRFFSLSVTPRHRHTTPALGRSRQRHSSGTITAHIRVVGAAYKDRSGAAAAFPERTSCAHCVCHRKVENR